MSAFPRFGLDMFEFTTRQSHLRDALIGVATGQRAHKNGVLLRTGAGDSHFDVMLISTDGKVLSQIKAGECRTGSSAVIMPRDFVERVAHHKLPRGADDSVRLVVCGFNVSATMAFDDTEYRSRIIDCTSGLQIVDFLETGVAK